MDFSTSNIPGIGSSISHNGQKVSSLSYHNDGQHLFVATEGDSKITVVDAIQTGKSKGIFSCQREGVSVVAATHDEYCILSAGKKQNTIQYWSLYDNKVIRKFRGHTSPVHELSVCPNEDMVLSSSNGDVRLWNLQQAGCMAKIDLGSTLSAQKTVSSPRAVFDSAGLIFSIQAEMPNKEGNYIHMYDAREYDRGAFKEVQITTKVIQDAMKTHQIVNPPPGPLTINKLDFNMEGDRMLCQTSEGLAIVLDGFTCEIQRIFQSSSTTTTHDAKGTVSCFTHDGKSLLMGNDSGIIDVYDLQSGTTVTQLKLQGDSSSFPDASSFPDKKDDFDIGITALQCNPKYQQIASGCTNNTCLWIW
mmetsp:Transcript_32790/g.36520  ORF Transcript_32790/g.36520 Transcript_32790/m.36520 type:complete len:360 (+) Transcript_32790:42-1121(+)